MSENEALDSAEKCADDRIVALVGPRCSGKSTLGRRLAEVSNCPFTDLDEELLAAFNAARGAGVSTLREAGEVLSEVGQERFRDLEEAALRRVLERGGPRVLATGGGVVEREANRSLLRERCVCVRLDVEPNILRARMLADPTSRPSLTGAPPEDEIAALLARRNPLYEAVSHFTLSASSDDIEEVVQRLAKLL